MISEAKLCELLHHALGYGHDSSPGWRNYLCFNPGCENYDLCVEAVRRGWMTSRKGEMIVFFHATDAGKAAAVASWAGPKLRAFRVSCEDWDSYAVIAAQDAGAARMAQVQHIKEFHDASTRDLLMQMRVRRAPEFDNAAFGRRPGAVLESGYA